MAEIPPGEPWLVMEPDEVRAIDTLVLDLESCRKKFTDCTDQVRPEPKPGFFERPGVKTTGAVLLFLGGAAAGAWARDRI